MREELDTRKTQTVLTPIDRAAGRFSTAPGLRWVAPLTLTWANATGRSPHRSWDWRAKTPSTIFRNLGSASAAVAKISSILTG